MDRRPGPDPVHQLEAAADATAPRSRGATIASGAEDAAIIARADAIKAFGYPMYLAFHHEPEDDLATFGTPADYAAAFRHIVERLPELAV